MKHSDENQQDHVDDPMELVLRNVNPRPKPPAEVEQAVYEHVLGDWKKLRANKKRRKKVVYWSVAASVLMALLIRSLLYQFDGAIDRTEALASVEKLKGSISISVDNIPVQLAPGDKYNLLFSGQTFSTAANSGASLKWGENSTIRVDQNSEIYLHSNTKVELLAGQIYVDIPPGPGQTPSTVELRIITHLGVIDHIGTQFMVSSDATSVEVKVREGAVSIDNSKQVFVTATGQQSILGQSDQVSHKAISTHDPDWRWAEKLAPAFELDGRPLSDFLAWVSRETGKEILFDTQIAEDAAKTTIMHGSVDDEPLLALELVLQTNELSWYEQDGKIILFVSH